MVISDSRHDRTHKFKKNHQTLVRLYWLPFGLRLVNEPFHDIRMLTRMNSQHSAIQIRHSLFSYSFIVVLWINVLKNLFWCQRCAIQVISLYPQSRCMVVFIICNVNLILSEILLALFDLCISCYLYEPKLIFSCRLLDVLRS